MKKTHFFRLLGLLMWILMSAHMMSCGGISSAVDTQASLPIPDNSGITISSPNSEGYVTITANEAVPASATVLVNVDSATSLNLNLDLSPLLNVLIPSVAAQTTCTSDLPVCPELDANGECHDVANADGSFTLQVPAQIEDLISISYLDPDTCSEVEIFEGAEVNNETPALSFLGYDTAFDSANGFLYVAGITDEAQGVIAVLNASTHETVAINDSAILPLEIEIFGDENTNLFFVTQSSTETYLSNFDGASEGDLSAPLNYALADSSDNVISDLAFLNAHDFDALTDSFQPCSANLPDDLSNAATSGYTRAFFTDGTSMYFHEFQNSITATEPANTTTINGENAFNLYSFDFNVTDLSDESIVDVAHLSFSGSALFVVLGIQSPSLPQYPDTVYYYFNMSSDINYCAPITNIALTNGIEIGTSEDELLFQHGTWQFEDSTAPQDVFTVFRTGENEQDFYIFSQANTFNYLYAQFDLTDQTITTSNYQSSTLTGSETVSSLTITEPAAQLVEVPNSATDASEFAFISPYYGGSQFLSPSEDTFTDFGLATPLYSLYPLNVIYDSLNDQIIVLDIGLSSAETSSEFGLYSLIRFYELNATE